METIKNYLENMFKALPKTEKNLKLKTELFSNMEEKYNELKADGKTENEAIGIVIAEFGNIEELIEDTEFNFNEDNKNLPELTLAEADKFLITKKKSSILVGIGVVLCILGGVSLISLTQLIEDQRIFQTLTKGFRDILPISSVILIAIPAVILFIYSGIMLEKYKFIDNGLFQISPITKAILSEKQGSFSKKYKIALIIGVSLCILSPLAIFIGSALGESTSSYGVCVLLLIIAIAVFLFIRFGSIEDSYKKLLQTDEYSPAKMKNGKVIGAVASVIWPLATCCFLLGGFIFGAWATCWIIFPITGILFGGFCSIYNAIKKEEKTKLY